MPYDDNLISALREKIADTQWTVPRFSLRVMKSGASSAFLEITDGHFIVTTTGDVDPVDITLEDNDDIETIGQLMAYLKTLDGYIVEESDQSRGDPNHDVLDLQDISPTNILNTPYQFRTRRWGDDELRGFLSDALRRHNMSVPQIAALNYTGNYTLENVPEAHKYFVILLGQIEVIKAQIHQALDRKSTDLSVADYDTMKTSLESEYSQSLARLQSSVSFISPTQQTLQDNGNVMVGHSFRISKRGYTRGAVIPQSFAPMPLASTLTVVAEGSGMAVLEWSRNRDFNFQRYEIWRGITPGVSNRSRYVLPYGAVIAADGELVFSEPRAYQTAWVDGVGVPLETGTYYYRIYSYNQNGDFVASEAIPVTIS